MKKFLLLGGFMLLAMCAVRAQFTYGTTGLLHAPSADMQKDKTFMFGGSLMSTHSTPSRWDHRTWNYYINITIFPWLEVGYTCTLFSAKDLGVDKYGHSGYTNQDRSFHGRLRLWKEGWWKSWTPQIVAGVNDATTGSGGDYTDMAVEGDGNGFFNRYYVAATKHIEWHGKWGFHAAFVYNRRYKDHLKGPTFGVDYRFALPETSLLNRLVNGINLIAEYDSKYMNIGGRYSVWKDRIHFVGELRDCRHPSIGMYFTIPLK